MTTLRRINQDDLRNHNLSVVISTLLRAAEPMSRAELAKQTGLTKATMSLLVSMLVDNGVVREGTPSVQSSYGRPSTPLLIAGGRYCGIGLQVNTDGYGTIVLDLDGTVVAERWVDADMSDVDADDIFSELNALSLEQERLLADRGYTVTGTGLALPGLVTDDMRLLMARNLGWEQLDLKRFDVVRRLDATAGNEANMAALAQIPGYAMHREDDGIVDPNASFIYLSTDVGIGGAVVRGGHVEIGDHGFGGELGHVSVELRGPVCRCGRRGCLETYAGRRAMVESAGIASGSAAARRESINELIERWRDGDVKAAAVVDKAIEAHGLRHRVGDQHLRRRYGDAGRRMVAVRAGDRLAYAGHDAAPGAWIPRGARQGADGRRDVQTGVDRFGRHRSAPLHRQSDAVRLDRLTVRTRMHARSNLGL